MSELVEKLLQIHDSLTDARLPHAFGGAIALAYCTREPRGTRDLDLNVFVEPSRAGEVLAVLPGGVAVDTEDIKFASDTGQRRLWWGETPIDVFLNCLPLHDLMAEKTLWVTLAGRGIPIVDAASLVTLKVLIDRTRDWADIEGVAECDQGAIRTAAEALRGLLAEDDPRHSKLNSLRR